MANVDGFIGKLSPDGGYIWANRYGDANSQLFTAIDIESDGSIAVTGFENGALEFGEPCPPIGVAPNGLNVFAARVSGDGECQWATVIGPDEVTLKVGLSAAFDDSGGVVVAGWFEGTLAATDPVGSITSKDTTNEKADSFVVRFNADGVPVLLEAIGEDSAVRATVNGLGEIFVAGFAGGELYNTELTSAGATDIIALKLDPSGQVTWSKRLGGNMGEGADPILDQEGNLILVGSTESSFDFDGISVELQGTQMAVLARLRADSGDPVGVKVFGGDGIVQGRRVRVAPDGSYIMSGAFTNTVDFGYGPLKCAGDIDGFIVKLPPESLAEK
jgi:hypothetical protein